MGVIHIGIGVKFLRKLFGTFSYFCNGFWKSSPNIIGLLLRIFRSSSSSGVGRSDSLRISLAPIAVRSILRSSSVEEGRILRSMSSCRPGRCDNFRARESFRASFAARRSKKERKYIIPCRNSKFEKSIIRTFIFQLIVVIIIISVKDRAVLILVLVNQYHSRMTRYTNCRMTSTISRRTLVLFVLPMTSKPNVWTTRHTEN